MGGLPTRATASTHSFWLCGSFRRGSLSLSHEVLRENYRDRIDSRESRAKEKWRSPITGGLQGVVNITATLISTTQTSNCPVLGLVDRGPDLPLIDWA